MLNGVFVVLLAGAVAFGAWTGTLDEVATASAEAAKRAVELVVGLLGVMAFWLGMMRVLQRAGVVQGLARAFRPLLSRLFPGVPPEHPAMSMMLMNMSANALGLGNAATPFGLKAMGELDKLNPRPGTATNDMALFLAINTSGIALLPTGMIALRASLGSEAPGAIIVTGLIATLASTTAAIVMAKLLQGLGAFRIPEASLADLEREATAAPDLTAAHAEVEPLTDPAPTWMRASALALGLLIVSAVGVGLARAADVHEQGWLGAVDELATKGTLALLIALVVVVGVWRGVRVFDAVVEGGREAFTIVLKFVPYFIALIVAIGMFRASGALGALVRLLEPLTAAVGLPAAALPMALLRPLSGKGAFGVAAETMEAHGPDSFVGYVVSTMQGSTETTFYVLALYFGAVGIKRARHTLPACLVADVVGVVAAVWACRLLLA